MKIIGLGALMTGVGLLMGVGVWEGAAVPERPINLSVKGEFKGAVAVARLKWQDESEDELGFEILRADNGKDYEVVGFVGANTVRYEDKVGRYINGAFVYKVLAFNEEGKSPESNAASVWF